MGKRRDEQTRNTAWCVERFLSSLDPGASTVAIEEPSAADLVREHDEIVLAYPVYYSNFPKIVRDFIEGHVRLWKGKAFLHHDETGLYARKQRGRGAMMRVRDHGASGSHRMAMPSVPACGTLSVRAAVRGIRRRG